MAMVRTVLEKKKGGRARTERIKCSCIEDHAVQPSKLFQSGRASLL